MKEVRHMNELIKDIIKELIGENIYDIKDQLRAEIEDRLDIDRLVELYLDNFDIEEIALEILADELDCPF